MCLSYFKDFTHGWKMPSWRKRGGIEGEIVEWTPFPWLEEMAPAATLRTHSSRFIISFSNFMKSYTIDPLIYGGLGFQFYSTI